jgi:hypothetical protein
MQSRFTIALLLFVTAFPALDAAEPTIRNLDVRGLRIGGTTTLVIDGDDLGKTPKLHLPFPAKQTLKPDVTDKKATFEVTLAGDVVPGYYQMRVVTEGGVSLPVVIGVDRMPQQLVAAPITELPVALHGAVAGGATTEVKFTGKAKQKVIVEVEAQRFGSKLRPILHLYSPKKLQLNWSWAMPALHGDTRLEAILPEDGTYTATLHDVEYAAPAPSHFRMRIGDWSYLDQVYPPAVAADQAWTVSVLGSTPTQMSLTAPKGITAFALPWPKGDNWSGPQPFVNVGPHAEFVRSAKSDQVQDILATPAGISGRLDMPYAEERYRIPVKPLTKVRLEVFAERIGSPIDAALVVRNDKGDQLARAEDSPGTLDPVLEYTVPDKVASIIVGVVDAQGRGGPRGIYRLVVEPQDSRKEFRLTTSVQRLSLGAGSRTVVPVIAERRGYQGKIDLSASLPAGVKFDGAIIPEGADGSLVSLERSEAPFEANVAKWQGAGDDGIKHPVRIKGHPMERVQPWLANEIAVAPSNQKGNEFTIDWTKLPADAALVPGSKLALPINTVRPAVKTTVKLSLLTSQNTPIVNNQPDPNKSLRQEKPVEMPVKVVDGEIAILVPVELSAPVYDVTVQAELLDPAKKVLATAYAPVRRMAVKLPLVVKLDGPHRIETPYDVKKGATLKLQGKIERLPGVKADVALALTGLPAGAKADAVTVKADASDFAINITFPPTVPAGEIKGVKLSGSITPEPKTPNVRVKSREVELELVLKAPAK